MFINLEPEWVVGFVDGEGCFFVGINNNETLFTKKQVLPEFTIVQHKKDIDLLYALKDFFTCGVVRKNHGDRIVYVFEVILIYYNL